MSGRKKLTWSSAPLAELLRLAWPICVSMLSYSAMTLADTAFVGNLGKADLAGMGLAGILGFAAVVFGIGLLRGVKVVVSQAVGAGQDERVNDYAAAGILIAFVMAALVMSFGQLLVWALPAMAASEMAGEIGAEYLFIRLLSAPALFLFCTTRETSYGIGNSRSPMIASIIANLVNILLDYVFIVRMEFGASGAAWATFVATFLEAGLLLTLLRAPGFKNIRRGLLYLRAVLRVGIATGVQFAVEIGAFTLLTVLIASMSEAEMAAHQVALAVIHFGFLPLVAISEAASIMVGQAVGANRDALVSTVAKYGLLLGLSYALLFTVVLVIAGSFIAGSFGSDAEVTEISTRILYLAALFQIGDACNIVARGVLRGAGDVRWSATVCILVSWTTLPPLTWYFGYRLQMGAIGGWLAIVIEIFVGAGLLWWRFIRGGWLKSASASREALAQ